MIQARTLATGIWIALVSASLTGAAGKPDLSGEWKLDAGKSKLGPLPSSYSLARKVTHRDGLLTVFDSQQGGPGERDSTYKYAIGGEVSINQFMATPVESTAVWDGNSLVLTMKAEVQGFLFQRTDRWTLSPDGQVLTSVLTVHGGDGDFEFKFVMKKQ